MRTQYQLPSSSFHAAKQQRLSFAGEHAAAGEPLQRQLVAVLVEHREPLLARRPPAPTTTWSSSMPIIRAVTSLA